MHGNDGDTKGGEEESSETEGRSGESLGLTFEAAEDVVSRSRRELQPPPGTRPADARSCLARINKSHQASDLRAWAACHSCLLAPETFTRNWRSQGSVAGQECDVYYDTQSGCYLKRNNTIAYEDWIQFFQSIRVHNSLFLDTAYSFLGLMEVEGLLHAVLSQKAISSVRGASRSEVMNYMSQFGFRHVELSQWIFSSFLRFCA